MSDYTDLTNEQLRELLRARELPTSGTKAELVARLEESDANGSTQVIPGTTTAGVGIEPTVKTGTVREAIQAALAAPVSRAVVDARRVEIVGDRRFADPEQERAFVERRLRSREVHRIKSRACADAFTQHLGKNLTGVLTVRTRRGDARLSRVEHVELPDGNSCVEVWTGGGATGPPQFRIFNPPTLAEDPRGEVELSDSSGRVRRFREDPLAALAEVIASDGGSRR